MLRLANFIIRDQPIMLIILPIICYAALLKKSTYYAYINAQC